MRRERGSGVGAMRQRTEEGGARLPRPPQRQRWLKMTATPRTPAAVHIGGVGYKLLLPAEGETEHWWELRRWYALETRELPLHKVVTKRLPAWLRIHAAMFPGRPQTILRPENSAPSLPKPRVRLRLLLFWRRKGTDRGAARGLDRGMWRREGGAGAPGEPSANYAPGFGLDGPTREGPTR